MSPVGPVGLSAISLANYAYKGLCVTCLRLYDELRGVCRVMCGSTTPGSLCAMHALMPQDRWSRRCVCVGECAATGVWKGQCV